MASFCASITIKFDEGATFVFGSWLCIADWDDVLHRYFADDLMPKTTPPIAPALVAPTPARILPRTVSKKNNSETISRSYPTQRST